MSELQVKGTLSDVVRGVWRKLREEFRNKRVIRYPEYDLERINLFNLDNAKVDLIGEIREIYHERSEKVRKRQLRKHGEDWRYFTIVFLRVEQLLPDGKICNVIHAPLCRGVLAKLIPVYFKEGDTVRIVGHLSLNYTRYMYVPAVIIHHVEKIILKERSKNEGATI